MAVFFAISLVVLAPLVIGAIDIYMSSNQRARLQDALDAAALYAARSSATTTQDLTTIGRRALEANLTQNERDRLVGNPTFEITSSRILASAAMAPESVASGLWNHGNLTVNTEVVRSSQNIEVSLVLDITGSMAGSKITDLKSAATSLVDIVVQDVQTPYYTKMAIVPYSNAVNVGSYAAAVRSAIPAAKPITNITRASPGVVTSASHGMANGTVVYITGVNGMTKINDKYYTVANKTTNTFQVSGVNTTSGNGYSAYTSGGGIYCFTLGCQYYKFTDAAGGTKTFQVTTCVSERTGVNKYNDTSPSTSPVGYVYTASSAPENPCPTASIVPLTTDKAALKATIAALTDGGSTAGQIGLAWGWYMVSPNFGYLWPQASNRPAAYTAPETLKVVILMTDGAFNTAYCNGVIAKNSSSGSGSDGNHHDCNATNGSSSSQASSLCSAIKGQNIVLYTVGFDIAGDTNAQNLLSACATDSEHVYLPSSGTALQEAFRAIGRDINSLRLAH